jgi:hypothetical protein
MPSYEIQTNPPQVTLTSNVIDITFVNVQDDTDYILNRNVVLYPSDESVLEEVEKSVVF